MYKVSYHRKIKKDLPKLKTARLVDKAKKIIKIIEKDPFQNPPPYEKLVGNFSGMYSRRINIQHRIVYTVIEEQKLIKVLNMWSHYGE